MDESFGYTLPTALAPGMAAQFDIKPLSPSLAQKAKFASTNVQSEEFSSFDYNPSITPYQAARDAGIRRLFIIYSDARPAVPSRF